MSSANHVEHCLEGGGHLAFVPWGPVATESGHAK